MIQDGAAVDFAADLKTQPCGDVGFDQTRDDVHAGALRGQNQVNTGGTRFLCQTCNQLFNLFAHHHHQVGQLVNDDDHIGQTFNRLGRFRGQAEGVGQLLATRCRFIDLFVEACEVAHTQFAHEFVAPLHFTHAPVQGVGGLFHVGDNRAQQMWNALVDAHLQHLGVNQNQPHITRFGFVEQAQNHGVDAHRLA